MRASHLVRRHENVVGPHGGARSPELGAADGETGGGSSEKPGPVETLWVLDVDGTIVLVSAEVWPGPVSPC
jgi:hypothetical protein